MPDLTAPIVNWATDMIGSYGITAVFLLMVLESACIPVPSEAIMLFGGFLAGQGKVTFIGVVTAGVLGNLVGSWIAYWVGLKKGRDWALRWHWLHITPERLDMADRWFEKYGSWAVLIGRVLPIVRTFISLPAGVARMPFWRFTIYTFLGCIPWMAGLTYIGLTVGDNWEEWKGYLHYIDYLVAVIIVAGAVYLFIRWWRSRGGSPDAPAA